LEAILKAMLEAIEAILEAILEAMLDAMLETTLEAIESHPGRHWKPLEATGHNARSHRTASWRKPYCDASDGVCNPVSI
jgi:hypothetical protein